MTMGISMNIKTSNLNMSKSQSSKSTNLYLQTAKKWLHLTAWLWVVCNGSRLMGHDQIPGAPQRQPIAIVGATVHTICGETLQAATVLFENGKLTQVSSQVQLPADTRVIDASGKHVYPGLIEANSDLGLVEINSIRASIDSNETGNFNPNVQALVAFNPDSELIPVGRAGGVLTALSAPDGGLISGRSSLMLLDGWSRDDMLLQADVGMHVRWPSNTTDLKLLTEFFEQALRYGLSVKASSAHPAEPRSGQPRDLRLESLQAVLQGQLPVIVSVNELDAIRNAIAFKTRFGLKMIISGGTDACECAQLLKSESIPVIVTAVYSNPTRRHSAYDEAYTFPKRLHEAGIDFCISAGGRFGANSIRNLPYNAATAAAYGLPERLALRAITLSPAEILGVSHRIGSLQVGSDATLLITDGNILETFTQVEQAFIQGRAVDLSSRHTQLYRKYAEKYERSND
jgi:imidazolonepropionase-like amidohydrolase